jgi:hypothetical protein
VLAGHSLLIHGLKRHPVASMVALGHAGFFGMGTAGLAVCCVDGEYRARVLPAL